jgi:hypothetical protein
LKCVSFVHSFVSVREVGEKVYRFYCPFVCKSFLS